MFGQPDLPRAAVVVETGRCCNVSSSNGGEVWGREKKSQKPTDDRYNMVHDLYEFSKYHPTGTLGVLERSMLETAVQYYNRGLMTWGSTGVSSAIESDAIKRWFLSSSEVIGEIRSALSLQVKEIAEIVGVQRPHVYSWINNESKPRGDSATKLAFLHQVAQAWHRLCSYPCGSLIRTADSRGESLLDLLRRGMPDHNRIDALLLQLAQEASRMNKDPQKRMSARQVAQKKGIVISGDNSDLIDALTGKRSHPE